MKAGHPARLTRKGLKRAPRVEDQPDEPFVAIDMTIITNGGSIRC